jgi:hypothetical protein
MNAQSQREIERGELNAPENCVSGGTRALDVGGS